MTSAFKGPPLLFVRDPGRRSRDSPLAAQILMLTRLIHIYPIFWPCAQDCVVPPTPANNCLIIWLAGIPTSMRNANILQTDCLGLLGTSWYKLGQRIAVSRTKRDYLGLVGTSWDVDQRSRKPVVVCICLLAVKCPISRVIERMIITQSLTRLSGFKLPTAICNAPWWAQAVSYTHLTLPTIYS